MPATKPTPQEKPRDSNRDSQRILLSAIDNALRNGSYMTGANLALDMLYEDLGKYETMRGYDA